MLEEQVPEPFFIAFFDEAGDPGIKAVAPIDPKGASEWFLLSCVVVRASTERNVVEFIKRVKNEIKSHQRPDLHFRQLSEYKKLYVCNALAQETLRGFVLASNKKNMRGYRNRAAEELSAHPNNWFYNYCIRLLLERVSEWCERKSIIETGSPKYIKLIFSKRGGHSYRHVETYTELLANQSKNNRLYQTARVPKFSVLDHRLIEVIAHERSAGCQLADIFASAFFQAVNPNVKNWSIEYAKALKPRMASINNTYVNQGLTLLPWDPRKAALSQQQKTIFEYYGYQL